MICRLPFIGVTPLILVVAFSACCLAAASEHASASVVDSVLELADPLGSGWALGDLDGDRETDIALSSEVDQSGSGYVYRVELKMSQSEGAGSFTFANTDALGVDIAAVDVDGDHDLDLVISGRFSLQRIGVWINDGRGIFTQHLNTPYFALIARSTNADASVTLVVTSNTTESTAIRVRLLVDGNVVPFAALPSPPGPITVVPLDNLVKASTLFIAPFNVTDALTQVFTLGGVRSVTWAVPSVGNGEHTIEVQFQFALADLIVTSPLGQPGEASSTTAILGPRTLAVDAVDIKNF